MNDLQEVDFSKPAIGGIDAQALITRAIEMNLDIDKMERILAMRRELKAEFSREEYFRALSAFQKDCPVIEKKKAAKDKSGNVRYKYAPLDEIVQQISSSLEAHGFSYTIKTKQTAEAVTAICFAHHKAGHFEETSFTVPIDVTAYMSEAQKTASALTYAKRYAFCDAFGIMTGDEDNDADTQSPDGKPEGKPDLSKNKKPTDAPASPELAAAGAIVRDWIKKDKKDNPTNKEKQVKVYQEFMALITAKKDAEAIEYAKNLSLPVEMQPPPSPVEVAKISEIFDGAVVETIPGEAVEMPLF